MPCQARQAISYTMPNIVRPYHIPCLTSPGHNDILFYSRQTIPCQCDIPCDAHQAIQVTMTCPPVHIIYHDITDRPYHIPCHARQAMPYTRHPAKPHHMQSHTSTGNTIYHAMPARTYHIPCQARQALPYTTPCPSIHCIYHGMPQGHIIYHAMLARTNHIPCQARQAIPYIMPYPIGHTKCHARQPLLYTMRCLPGYIIIPYHAPYHARKATPYTMPCPLGHTIYHAIPSRP